jgi:hypothetical protein
LGNTPATLAHESDLSSGAFQRSGSVDTFAIITGVAGEIAPRSRLSWLAIVSRLCAAALFLIALLAEGQSERWVLLACAGGLAIVPIAWRRKGPVVPGAIFATSADYLPAGLRRGQFPGELSVTTTTLTWNPSRHSIAKGLAPIAFAMDDVERIAMKGGPALLDVIITVQRREGGECLFLTHRSPGLHRAVAKLSDLTAH